ncbi:hypothetical protein [Pseudalkalibacillus hwajinpoensis]|uniref:Lipoprotein n=1 Tax=Guptibacillus hwajinpoensis TaxID=208199 RepID=A0A4U1MKT8_9BACL|nr:hypothetical protein [Pseudalkalibacillus hwajinpoensis]TKD71507.1 hypothetical protein FBF83_01465 [Pseudalkalibacillus hwajinpoensis]
MKKLQLSILAFVTLLILLVGCQQTTLSFKGEGDYWEGKYISNQTSEGENGEFRFGYKGKDSVSDIEYKITSNTGNSSGEINVNGKSFTHSTSCTGCAKTNEDEEIKVIIKWDGTEDAFILKK